SLLGAEGGPERLVAADHLVERSLKRVGIEGAIDPDRQRDVVERATRLELIEEPEPLLRERGGERAIGVDGVERRRGRARALAQSIFEAPGMAGDMRRLEQAAERQIDAKQVPDPRHQPGSQERMAPQIEEVVVDANPRSAEHLAPDGCEG